jgi:hypothetical protein
MVYEEISEPVEVITFFENGRVHPLRFKWKGTVHRVRRVNGSWSSRDGERYKVYFSVSTDGPDCYELLFDATEFKWELTRVALDG